MPSLFISHLYLLGPFINQITSSTSSTGHTTDRIHPARPKMPINSVISRKITTKPAKPAKSRTYHLLKST